MSPLLISVLTHAAEPGQHPHRLRVIFQRRGEDWREAQVIRSVDVASSRGQGHDHLDITKLGADMHHGGANAVPRMHVRPAIEEEPRDVVAPEPDREHQRRHPGSSPVIYIIYISWESDRRRDRHGAVDRRALGKRALEPLDVVGEDRGNERVTRGLLHSQVPWNYEKR